MFFKPRFFLVIFSLFHLNFVTPQTCPGGYWDPAAQTCFLFSGTVCELDSTSPTYSPCIPTASCYKVNGNPICVCHHYLQPNEDKMCHLVYGDRCRQENDFCDPIPFLKCSLENRCDCGKGGWYDEGATQPQCKLLPGTACSTDTTTVPCIEGTTCQDNNGTLTCQCTEIDAEPNLGEPPFCVWTHDETCDDSNPHARCDPSLHLKCVGGTCICDGEPATSFYDNRTQTCLRLAEMNCVPGKEGMKCVPGAICTNTNITGVINTKCQCRYPLCSRNDGFCFLPNGQDCTRANDLCDPSQFLECDFEGKCSCRPGSIFDEVDKVCVLLPGQECNHTQSCINGTECKVDDERKVTCQCSVPSSQPSKDDPTKCVLSHGRECSSFPELCDPYSHLACNGDICLCQGEKNSSIYDDKTRKCLRLAEESCSPETDDLSGGMSCIPTAACNKLGFQYKCQCRYPMSRGSDGFCYLQHNQHCTMQNDLCNKNKFLTCDLEGQCSCRKGTIYNSTFDTCLILPEEECDSINMGAQMCVPSTECIVQDGPITKSICQCTVPESQPSKDDPTKCFLSHFKKCNITNEACDPFSHLECKNGICICQGEDTMQSIYDPKTQKCLRLAEQQCDLDGMSCIHTASCKNYQCQCRFPMSRGTDGFCYLQHQQNCTQLNDLCDPLKFLECDFEGKCSCRRDSVFDPLHQNQSCVLLPGVECNKATIAQLCINGTECKLDQFTRKVTCQCSVPSSYPSKDDPTKCFLSHGRECSSFPESCDPYSHLACNGDICLCQGEKNSSIYDDKTHKCLRLAEESCSPEPGGGMGCIPTAACKKVGSQYECQCRYPMSRGSDGLCYLQHNQNCTMQNDLCNKNKYLSCNHEGQCTCGKGTMYNSTLDTCLILPEEECDPINMGAQLCVPSTECIVQNGPIAKSICQCPGASRPSKNNPTLCVLHHNQPCRYNTSETELCDPFAYLECSEDLQCACKGGGFRVYADPVTMTCYLKAGIDCTPPRENPHAQKCTPNSNCFQQEGFTTCICKAGFEPNRNGQCFLPHQSKCSLTNDLCDPASFLKCDLENHCTCGKEAIFNDVTKTCELLSNATCLHSDFQSFPPTQPCIPNSNCSKITGRCECIYNFDENQDRQCFLMRTQPCDKSRDFCDEKSYLTCSRPSGQIYDKCLCQGEVEGLGWFNQFQKKCFRLAGALCGRQDESNCIPNSYCDPIDKKCVCNETMKLVANQDKFCFIPHAIGCNKKNDLCDPAAFLECQHNLDDDYSESTCGCQRGYETFYDPASSSCRLISDRPCNPGNGVVETPKEMQLCDQNARCLPNAPGNFTYRCRCNDKYIPNPEAICYLPHRSECALDPTSCDPYGYLKCRRRFKGHDAEVTADVRQCICATDQMYYDEELRQCFSFPGEVCDISPTAQKCRKNAHCGKNNICECNLGYEPTPDGQCLLKYRESCEGDLARECHSHANLHCRGGYCLCPEGYIEHHYYDGQSHQNKTMCIPGFNMTCEHKLWLNFPKLKCSPDAFLQCNETVDGGICLCQHLDQVFLGPERQCRSTRGMSCDNYQRLCVPGAECIPGDGNKPIFKCECAENYTANWMDPRFCISGSLPLFLQNQNVSFILISLVISFITQNFVF